MIDPRVSAILNIVLFIVTAVGAGTISFVGIVDAATGTKIMSGAMMLSVMLNAILHGYSAPKAGPLVNGTPPAT